MIEFEDLYLTEFVRPVLDVSDLAPPWHRRSDPTGEPAPGSVAPPVPARPSGRAVLGVAAMTVAVVLTGLGNRPAANPGPTTGMLLESSFAQLVPSFTSPCVASALTSIDATRSPVCAAALAAHARALEFDPLR